MPRQSKSIPAALPEPETIDIRALASSLRDGETDLVVVLGPTASGKTKYAVGLARELSREFAGEHTENLACGHNRRGLQGAEIISADSRQVYRGMDIGTGKDLSEYGDVPYHLIDIADPGDGYNVYRFREDFFSAFSEIRSRGAVPILCGGTGLYINSVLNGYDFEENIPLSERRGSGTRELRPFVIGTLVSREVRNARIDARLKSRLEEGMVGEIRGLLDSGVPAQVLLGYGLEYRFVTRYILGEIDYEGMYVQLSTAIHQFAKRQMTWFRGMERSGVRIHWTEV